MNSTAGCVRRIINVVDLNAGMADSWNHCVSSIYDDRLEISPRTQNYPMPSQRNQEPASTSYENCQQYESPLQPSKIPITTPGVIAKLMGLDDMPPVTTAPAIADLLEALGANRDLLLKIAGDRKPHMSPSPSSSLKLLRSLLEEGERPSAPTRIVVLKPGLTKQREIVEEDETVKTVNAVNTVKTVKTVKKVKSGKTVGESAVVREGKRRLSERVSMVAARSEEGEVEKRWRPLGEVLAVQARKEDDGDGDGDRGNVGYGGGCSSERRTGKGKLWGRFSSLVLSRIKWTKSTVSSSAKRASPWAEEQDQPSPVSVLEASLGDDGASSPDLISKSPPIAAIHRGGAVDSDIISRSSPIRSIARDGGAAAADDQRRQVEHLLDEAGFEEVMTWKEALARWQHVDPRMHEAGADSSVRLIADAVDEAIQEAIAEANGGFLFRERIIRHVYGLIDGKDDVDSQEWKKAAAAAKEEIRREIEDELMENLFEEFVADVIFL